MKTEQNIAGGAEPLEQSDDGNRKVDALVRPKVRVNIWSITKISFRCDCGLLAGYQILGDEKPKIVRCDCGLEYESA